MSSRIVLFLLLIFCLIPVLTAGQASAKSSLIRSIFKYEREAANKENLPFKSEVNVYDGVPYLKFSYENFRKNNSEYVIYRQRLLIKRFLEAGGSFVEIIDATSKKKQLCSKSKNQIDLSCYDWVPIE